MKLLLVVCLLPGFACSKPILIPTKGNCIFVGNCTTAFKASTVDMNFIFLKEQYSEALDMIYRDVPNSRTFENLKDYQAFKVSNEMRPKTLFVLTNQDDSKPAILYQLEASTQKEINHYILPANVSKGSLVLSDVFYKEHWHTLLVLTIMDQHYPHDKVMIFEVTSSNVPLKPIMNYASQEISAISSKPVFLRFKNGQFGIAIGGHLKEQAVLQIILFDNPQASIRYKFNGKSVTDLLAVDIYQQIAVNRIYLSDREHLWVLDLTKLNQSEVRLLANIKDLYALVALSNPQAEGLRLYFIGRNLQFKGLFMLEDPLSTDVLVKEPRLICEGDYAALFARFGQLWVIPRQRGEAPLSLSLPSHLTLAIRQQGFYPLLDFFPKEEVIVSKLMWDPKRRVELLLTMNLSCQLNVFALYVDKTRYGRIMWRRLK